ncbi:sulfotransferase family protein [Oricola nitratireducens]|uniref:sulfotransferase family protein n=1 Tax=Oricola nitratireducens TaxID=2775868 RepID=UPI001868A942|nr:sulfotransferase family protein [Oricola nitratireducens]
MALKVIGSGFGRTGTLSTKLALEELGFGPCHQMVEVMGNPAQPARWAAVAAGEEVDWEEVFEGYKSQVDWPGAAVWRQTAIAFPDAKIVHTERPEDDWWKSFEKTIGKFMSIYRSMPLPPEIAGIFDTMQELIIKPVFGGHISRETAIAAYRRNNALVRETIPADRLLVFDVAEGWEPLCRFLDVPVPAKAFPRSNQRDEFWAKFGGEPDIAMPADRQAAEA